MPPSLRDGAPEEFAACRELLRSVPYTEEALRARYRIAALSGLSSRQPPAQSIDDGLELLTQLFVDGHYATRDQIASLLPPESLDTLARLGLLAPSPRNRELWVAPVMLYPRAGLYLVSDRPRPVDGAPTEALPDIVFSALTEDTERFLELLPDEPCDSFLDLGTGTGVAALSAASSARQVWAVDITERAVRFAEFNRRLNGLGNVTVLQGDLCAPVGDLRFDRIVLHPPYVPALRQTLIYQDAGLDGQDITRRAVSQLPRHLNPGGRFYCLTVGVDGEDAPFERTVRRWLEPDDAGFDVAFVAREPVSLGFMARSVALKSGHGAAGAARLEDAFRRLRIREFVYGAIVIQRQAIPRTAFTVRRQRASGGGRAAIAWLLRWETELAHRGPAWLLDTRPRASPGAELLVTHRMVEGELAPSAYRLQADRPFSMEARAAVWMGALLARADGVIPVRDHFEYLKEHGAFPPDIGPADFARVLGQLVSGGFLWIPGFEPPA
jgi:methylase of polypeptide subunit release factors